jgi:hypothetical protein
MVYVTTSPSRASGNSSMTNGNAGCFASTTTSKKQKVHTNVQEGTFVFQVTRPEMLAIRRLQDLYEYHQRGTGNLDFGSLVGDEGASLRSSFASDPTANPVLSALSNEDRQQQQQKQHDQTQTYQKVPKQQQQTKQSTSTWFGTNFIGDSIDLNDNEDNTTLGTPVFKNDEMISVDMIVMTKRICHLLELKSFCSSNCTAMKSYNNASIIDMASTTATPAAVPTNTKHDDTDNDDDDDGVHFHPSLDDDEVNAEYGQQHRVDESDEKTVVPDNASVTTAATHASQPIATATFARLSDHSGWITIEVNGEDYVDQVAVEAGLYTFYVDNFSSGGITPRRHPMDDSSSLLSTENCIQDIVHIQPMTQIYCDYKVIHPVTKVEFYRIQRTNSSYFPLWVHNIQYANDSQRFPNIYKLLPISKYKYGTFAYRALQGTVLRSIPDCSETSKVHSDKAIVRINEIVVADLIRESPIPVFGNGPFMRLNSYGWLFEKKLHERVFEPIPIQSGHWEFLVCSSWSFDMSNSVDSFAGSTNIKSKTEQQLQQQKEECIMVFQQPLGRSFLHDGYVAKLHVGDIIQCDRKITVHNKQSASSSSENGSSPRRTIPTTSYDLYRVILNDTNSGWIIDNYNTTIANDYNDDSNINCTTKPAMLQLLSSDEIDIVQIDTVTKSLDPPTKDELNINTTVHDTNDDEYYDECDEESSATDEWTPALVREIASVCGSILKEIDYQPIGNVLKFETRDMILINVFCSTRTVQTAFEDFVDFESIGMNHTSKHGGPFGTSNMMYQCYRNCSIRQLTKILQITVVTLMSKAVVSMTSSSHEDEEDDKHVLGMDDDDQKENSISGQRFFVDGNDWDDIEDEKKDESDSILDETLENVLSRNTALLDALAFRASSRKCNNRKKTNRKKIHTRLYFREIREQELIRKNIIREKKVRDELLRCEMDILKLLSKRQQLWETVQQFEEQRSIKSQQHSKIRLYQMN